MTAAAPTGLIGRCWQAISYPLRLHRHLRAALAQIKTLQTDHQDLASQLDCLQQEHAKSVAWIQLTYPQIVEAVGKKIEPQQFGQLSQDVYAALHREIGTFRDRLQALEAAAPLAARVQPVVEDSRSIAFYLDLERRFRGTAEELAQRFRPYLEYLRASPVAYSPLLDIGCGRGEWLSLLAKESLPASGVDLNPINGDYCRSSGLRVFTCDALDHLKSLPAASLGSVTAFHLVEHLPFPVLLALTDEIFRALKPGGLLIYETPNPENLLVASHTFWIDPTHQRPIPPELLQFTLMHRGFVQADILRLHEGPPTSAQDPLLQTLLAGPRDYAVLARKPG